MYRSPAGPPPGPTSPWPASRMRMPSSMPAGTSTVLVRRARTRPSVPQVGHGDGICSPVPPQAEQARVVMTWPRNERCTDWISPAPPQVAQVRGLVPGAQPSPWQVSHTMAVSTVISRRTPNAVSSSVSEMLQQRVGARPHPAAPAAAAAHRAAAAEERLEHVAEPAEAAERAAGRRPAGRRQRVAAEVDDAPLLGVGEHLVGGGDLLEPVLRRRVGVDVRVQLAGELAVGALELLGRRVLAHAEQP